MRIFITTLVILFFTVSVHSQVNLEWAACYNGPNNDRDNAEAICVDDSGNVYLTGFSRGQSSNFEYATIKYDPYGQEQWVRRYSEQGNNIGGADITSDTEGNIYVTGKLTIKYDSDGNELWISPFGGIRLILVDTFLYIGGSSIQGGTVDFSLVKLKTNGNLLWQKLYNGTANNSDRFRDVVLDSKGNIIVIGESRGEGTYWDYVTIKYSPEGDSLWVRRYNGPCSLFPGDYARAVTVDDEDNVYVTGWSDGVNCDAQCFTIAYNSDGELLWDHRYPYGLYVGEKIIYSDNYIYVIASSYNSGVNLLKYNKQGSLISDVSILPHGSPGNPPQIMTDKFSNIFVSAVKGFNYTLVKISPIGTILWEYQYPGASNPGSFVRDMTMDNQNNIYITGYTIGWVCPGGDYDYLTIKISQDKVGIDPHSEIVTQFELFQNYPNPFNPETTIRFAIPKNEFVELKIYDLLGREIKTLMSEERPAGIHNINWNAEGVSSGVYYYRLTAGEFSETRKLVLLR